ncbi:MAG: hypothetical protein RL545_627, partial [Actinomycetota bacterium]
IDDPESYLKRISAGEDSIDQALRDLLGE